eukprot:XP_011619209.1 PREDICTED: cell adhesion molecule 4-like [Takifugu rubripes]
MSYFSIWQQKFLQVVALFFTLARVRTCCLGNSFAPTVRILPPSGILREGDSLSLTCSVTGNPLPRDIQWSRINDTLPERAEISGPTFQISRLSQTHNGTYLCQAQNDYGRAADHYSLLVYDNVSVTPVAPSTPPSHPTTPTLLTPSSYLTHEASGLDEHGEVQEAFLNGSESGQGKKEYLL